ncbi:hypothetical protein [Micromonospora sp. NPDC048830]|uniref:hypothetical protein n=1 Tax=Micromonospora sp. NPDC048830 TaxID=3364257 RepID=UPI003717F717
MRARIATGPVFLVAAVGRGTGVILEQRQVRVSRVLASAYGGAGFMRVPEPGERFGHCAVESGGMIGDADSERVVDRSGRCHAGSPTV